MKLSPLFKGLGKEFFFQGGKGGFRPSAAGLGQEGKLAEKSENLRKQYHNLIDMTPIVYSMENCEFKRIEDIHFSVLSVIVDYGLRTKFFAWATGKNTDFESVDWLCSPISKSDFPEGVEWPDIMDYACKVSGRRSSLSKLQDQELKIARMETAEYLFDRFLHEGLDKEESLRVEKLWNQKFNSFESVDRAGFDFSLKGFSGKLDGKKFAFHEQQKSGVAFLCSKGNGLLAYEVGVGKTATGIAALVWQLQHKKCSRPMIVVPKAVYPKWLHDTRELFPDIKINALGNMNKSVIERLRAEAFFDKNGQKSDSTAPAPLLPQNSISICAAETLENIFFTHESAQEMAAAFESVLSPKKQAEALLAPESLGRESYVLAEELGFDLLLVDEAHRYKNLIRKVSHCGHTEFSGLGFGEPSARSVKMFSLTEFVHAQNGGKNVFFLTATPFTNSPMEIYSTLLYVGGGEFRRMGYNNVNDFLNEFAQIKLEWSVNNKNQVVQKIVMKNFRSLDALQKIIQNYIDKASADDANVKRPQKETHVVKIELSELQTQIQLREIERITYTHSLGDIFVGMNNMRMNMISPALVNEKYPNIKLPNIKDLVKSSPKLTTVSQTIFNVYKAKPDCGQIVYLPRGVQESSHLKRHLAGLGIPQSAIALINSHTSDLQKQKITESFNDPKGKIKILIGSETISEGVDLNGNTLALYNCMLGWNPTEPVQVEGRLWRQGNRQKKVHVIYPLMYNSLDSLIYQKHDEKASRIDALWNYRGDKLNVEEINPAELKFDLIKSADMKANLAIEKEILPLKKELRIIDESVELIGTAGERAMEAQKEIKAAEEQLEKLERYKADNEQKKTGVPDALKRLNNMISAAADQEIDEIKKTLSSRKRAVAQINASLKKKLAFALGDDTSAARQSEYLQSLESRKQEVLQRIKVVEGKRDFYTRTFQAQYDAEQKAKLHSVPQIVKELTKAICEE